jgi:hypothetical protein
VQDPVVNAADNPLGGAVQPSPNGQSWEPKPGAFRWAQVESSDYRKYIGNLRGIGCPERTIRDIISADVHSLYEQRRKQVQRDSLAGTSTSARVTPRQGLEELRNEEAKVVLELLGPEPAEGSADSVEVAKAGSERPERLQNSRERDAVRLPLVFQDTGIPNLKLDESQDEVLGRLRQQFREEIGGEGQDRSSLEYRRKWQQAQPKSDSMVRGMLGSKFYLDYQILAAQRAPQSP